MESIKLKRVTGLSLWKSLDIASFSSYNFKMKLANREFTFLITAILLTLPLFFNGSGIPGVSSTDFTPRKYYGAPLELSNKVYHGAGQDPKGFQNYFNAMPPGTKPAIYKAYIGLDYPIEPFFIRLRAELEKYKKQGIYLIPEIGLMMAHDGTPSRHYEQDVVAGLYDEKLEQFCQGIAGLGHPVFVRIGFEFNGLSWNGYKPKSYKKAFIKVTKAMRSHRLDAAIVWCVALPLHNGTYDYMEYYPGDAYVDWWGIDLFDKEDFDKNETKRFMAKADKHKMPVMLGEVTPRCVGVDDGQADWEAWFEPYFQFIQDYPGVKAVGYINWRWADYKADYPDWYNWGDARLETNRKVLGNYIYKSTSSLYYHGSGEKEYRTLLAGNDTIPPSGVSGLSGSFNGYAVELKWDGVSDNNSVIRYEVFKGKQYLGSTTETRFFDKILLAGDIPAYTVRAVDSGANRGPFSSPVSVSVSTSLNKVSNGEFDRGLAQWSVESGHGGTLVSSMDTKSKLSGANSVKLLAVGTGTNWHLQFRQYFNTNPGKTYRLSFTAVADAPVEVQVFMQQAHDPYNSIFVKTIKLSKTAQTFEFTNTYPSSKDRLALAFMFGQIKKRRSIWLDNIRLIEE